MRIHAKKVKSNDVAYSILRGYRRLHTSSGEEMPGGEWWRNQPGGCWQCKLYIISFHPRMREREKLADPLADPLPGAEERALLALARKAARFLEARKGIRITWAAGIRLRSRDRPVRDVWLFMLPWAQKGRRRWWHIDREDLAALREHISALLERM